MQPVPMVPSSSRPAPRLQTRLRPLRRQRGLTQADLAQAAGVSRQTIISLEKRHSVPSLALALQLAQILRVTVEDLFWLVDD